MMLPRVLTRLLAPAIAALLLSLTHGGLFAQSDTELEQQARVADLLRLLGAQPGSMIADVGAGDGFFTVRIARAVAPNGRAVAVDISDSALTKLRERAARENTGNIDVILGAIDDPHLAVGRFDAALIHNAYHEMSEHEAMLRHIRAALKAGGRLLVVEPIHDSSRGLPRDQQVAKHDIEANVVDGELKAAGFDVVERDDSFIKFTGVPGGFWLILASVK
jgi:predicted methyltransferase